MVRWAAQRTVEAILVTYRHAPRVTLHEDVVHHLALPAKCGALHLCFQMYVWRASIRVPVWIRMGRLYNPRSQREARPYAACDARKCVGGSRPQRRVCHARGYSSRVVGLRIIPKVFFRIVFPKVSWAEGLCVPLPEFLSSAWGGLDSEFV